MSMVIHDLATDLRERLEGCLLWHSEVFSWPSRLTADLTAGERAWLDDNFPIYARRYREARGGFLDTARQLLETAGKIGLEAPLLGEAVAEIAAEDYPSRSLDGWDGRVEELVQEATRIAAAALSRPELASASDRQEYGEPDADARDWVTVTQAANTISVAKGQISKLCASGQIECRGEGRSRRVNLNSLARWKKELDRKRL